MKITIFYSWQADLKNNKNRGLIENAIDKAKKSLLTKNMNITEIEITSDSRGVYGTPDLVSSIFNKIEKCDIFIADVSIINAKSNYRETPNPNVLIELGFAARTLGWNRIICLFNSEYAQIEQLPFDIRSRKPIIYNSSLSIKDAKKHVTKCIENSVSGIINDIMLDKIEYRTTKRTIDLAMQAILMDFCKLLFDESEKYNYNKLLILSPDEIAMCMCNKEILGFYLYMNIPDEIKEFTEYFNDELETYFLSNEEKQIVAKLVFALKTYDKILRNHSVETHSKNKELRIIKGDGVNPSNKKGSLILARPDGKGKYVVISGGVFENCSIDKLLNIYKISTEHASLFSIAIHRITVIINKWIKLSGNYFIANIKGLK